MQKTFTSLLRSPFQKLRSRICSKIRVLTLKAMKSKSYHTGWQSLPWWTSIQSCLKTNVTKHSFWVRETSTSRRCLPTTTLVMLSTWKAVTLRAACWTTSPSFTVKTALNLYKPANARQKVRNRRFRIHQSSSSNRTSPLFLDSQVCNHHSNRLKWLPRCKITITTTSITTITEFLLPLCKFHWRSVLKSKWLHMTSCQGLTISAPTLMRWASAMKVFC